MSTRHRSALLLGHALALLCLLSACSDGAGTQTDVEMLVVSGDAQRGPVGAELAQPVVARLVDASGAPVKGQAVTFKVTSGGGSVFAGTGTTNAQGEVRERWTLGLHTAEAQTLEARMVDSDSGEARVLGTFSATPLPLQAEGVRADELFTGTAGSTATAVAVALDVHGNPVPGVTLQWAPVRGGLQPQAATSVTDAKGEARMGWALPEVLSAGAEYVGQVQLAGAFPRQFTLRAEGGPAVALRAVRSDCLGNLPGQAPLALPDLVALDQFGNQTEAVVTLQVAEGGGHLNVDGSPAVAQLRAPALGNGTLASRPTTRGFVFTNLWVLGAAGAQRLTASLPNGTHVTFTAQASSPFAALRGPEAGGTVSGDSLRLTAFAFGFAADAVVRVTAADRTVTLAQEGLGSLPRSEAYTGTLDLTGLPTGPLTLSATFTDGEGHSESHTVTVTRS